MAATMTPALMAATVVVVTATDPATPLNRLAICQQPRL